MATDWGKILGIAIPAGVAGTGAILSARAQNNQNQMLQGRTEEMDRLARDQYNRQGAFQNLLLPSLLQAMRRKDPAMLAQVKAGGGAPPGAAPATGMQPQAATTGLAQPGTPNMGLLGDLGTGAALGGTFGGPPGAAMGAIYGAASNVFGPGRRAADPWTKTTQNDFGQKVAGIIDPFNAAQASGSLDDAAKKKAQDDFNQLLAQYTASANQYGGSGKQQGKVIGQMWNQFNGPGYIPDWKKTLGIQ